MLDFDYYRPQTTNELMTILDRTRGQIVAGGTDVLPRLRRGQFVTDCLIDISHLNDLRIIRETEGKIQIGALTTHAGLITSTLIQQAAPALVEAASTVGSPQTRHRGTIGGNLANASPAADSAPPLLVLNANVHLASIKTVRSILLSAFFTGPGMTCLNPGEYIHHISFNHPQGKWGNAFYKLGKRSGMAISIASAAAHLELGHDGRLQTARLAFGSVASSAIRSLHAESILLNCVPTPELFQKAGQAALEDISPISDIRASLEYRMKVIPILAQRALMMAWQRAEKRSQ